MTRSPFPGMDPYLERRWNPVHARLVTYVADALAPQLASDLAARPEEDVRIDVDGEPRRARRPDVVAVEEVAAPPGREGRDASTAAMLLRPVLLRHPGPVTARRVRIVTLPDERVVTSIELISPWNKTPGRGRDAYLARRELTLESGTNLVEVDLVRAGHWMPMLAPYRVTRPHRTTYRATVSRAADRPGGPLELYPIRLSDPLPTIPVPLRDGEPDVRLDLQAVVDRAYLYGGYANTDYAEPCDPPLAGDEAAWADALLRAAGRRA